MAKRVKKLDVQQFSGVEDIGRAKLNGNTHHLNSIAVESDTKIQADQGQGEAAIIRCFSFKANPETFHQRPPSTQDLFNAHHQGIEIALWKDGLKAVVEIAPRVVFDQHTGIYQIFVTARPKKGYELLERPKTLIELTNG